MKSASRLFLSLFFLSFVLLAQNEDSVLTGRVIDPSGSGVANASIRLTENSTGAVRDARSLEDGLYRFELLPPGAYSIHVTAQGFRDLRRFNLRLDVAKTSTFDVPLTLGAISQTIEVRSEVSPMETASAALGALVTAEKVQALPLNGRQFLQLALLAPGTNSGGLAVQQNSSARARSGDSASPVSAPTIPPTCSTAS